MRQTALRPWCLHGASTEFAYLFVQAWVHYAMVDKLVLRGLDDVARLEDAVEQRVDGRRRGADLLRGPLVMQQAPSMPASRRSSGFDIGPGPGSSG